MPVLETKGAISAQGFGLTLQQTAANYIEDVFSTWLYTGTEAALTITNGIDLSGKGGLVWLKSRSTATDHRLTDTARGVGSVLRTNLTNAAITGSNDLTSFNANGFSLAYLSGVSNVLDRTYASWTFREQPKFFDVVTYTGNGANRTIAHDLGSVPGCIIVKRINSTGDWQVYHRSLANTQYMVLNTNGGALTGTTRWNSTTPTSTVFSLGTDLSVNTNGGTYVAYLFAHDAGGFGLSGTDNVISCGSYTGNGSSDGPEITLGYEPQWLLIKRSSGGGQEWEMLDSMRGLAVGIGGDARLFADLPDAEQPLDTVVAPTATGFKIETASSGYNSNLSTYIYIAIRRGPMKVPTTGTSVFNPAAAAGNATVTTNFPVDLSWTAFRAGDSTNVMTRGRLCGRVYLSTSSTVSQTSYSVPAGYADFASNTTIDNAVYGSSAAAWWSLRRAPKFHDVVCYTGTGANTTITHNLAAVPELIIVKRRNGTTDWQVYSGALANTEYLVLNTTAAKATGATRWNSTTPTSSVFSLGTASEVNTASATYVAYLFASCPGVSKVGSYTGTGTTLQVNCGFSAGSRFVMIKRTDSTGDWYVWDSARGIVAGNDPYLLFNSAAAEVTSTDYVDTYSAGFEISSAAPAGINANGGTFIFLAIA